MAFVRWLGCRLTYPSSTNNGRRRSQATMKALTLSFSRGHFKVVAEKSGFVQPCRANVDLQHDTARDIFLVSNELLAKHGIPSSLPIIEPTISGLVFERTASGVRPVAGAGVGIDFTAGFGWAASAFTVSGPDGRFLLCNVTDVGFGIGISAAYIRMRSRSVLIKLLFPST